MTKLIFCLCFCLALPGLMSAQSNDYQKSVEKLLELSGASNTLQSIVPSLFSLLKQQTSGIPDIYWEEAEKEIMQTANADLAIMMVPVYRKYLSQEELDKIIEFYQTPAGHKLAEVNPQISAELLTIGQQWGLQLSQKVLQKLKDKGYF